MGWGNWGRSLLVLGLLCSLGGNGQASEVPGVGENLLSGLIRFSIGLPRAEVKNQGQFPYCGLFAVTSWLEIWREGEQVGTSVPVGPALDPAFLAVAYNYEFGAGVDGTNPLWLINSVQKWGVIPVGSVPVDRKAVTWPIANWAEVHKQLIDIDQARNTLEARYTHPSVSYPFTGAEYLEKVVRINLRHSKMYWAPQREKYPKGFPQPQGKRTPMTFRYGTQDLTQAHALQLAGQLGMVSNWVVREGADIYESLVNQLYTYHPVLVSVNVGLAKEDLWRLRNLIPGSLVPENTGSLAMHSMVAVAHCDLSDNEPVCERLRKVVEKTEDKEGIILHNSWGPKANDSGYVFVGRRQLISILRDGFLEK